jgi:hypothetical protein
MSIASAVRYHWPHEELASRVEGTSRTELPRATIGAPHVRRCVHGISLIARHCRHTANHDGLSSEVFKDKENLSQLLSPVASTHYITSVPLTQAKTPVTYLVPLKRRVPIGPNCWTARRSLYHGL